MFKELNNYPEALKAFEAGLALDPMNVPLHVNLALITRIVKGDDAARSVYLRYKRCFFILLTKVYVA